MRTDNIKVKLTIPIPVEKPDKNGVMYTEKAVENAVNDLMKNLPIRNDDGVVIGTTTGDTHIATWNSEKQVCNVTVDGVVFYGGTSCIINEIEDGVVTDFRITGFGLGK